MIDSIGEIIAPDGCTWVHSDWTACDCASAGNDCDCDSPSTCIRCGTPIGAGIPYWAEVLNYGVEICTNCPLIVGHEWDTYLNQ